jgi:hypothetical protein
MKATITFEIRRLGQPVASLPFEFDSAYPSSLWITVRSPEGVRVNDKAHISSKVYQLKVGGKGGLTLQ